MKLKYVFLKINNNLELRPTRNLGGGSILPLIYFSNCQHTVIKNNNRWSRVSFILYGNYLQKICPPTGYIQSVVLQIPYPRCATVNKKYFHHLLNSYLYLFKYCFVPYLCSPSRTPCACRLAFLILFHRFLWTFSSFFSSYPPSPSTLFPPLPHPLQKKTFSLCSSVWIAYLQVQWLFHHLHSGIKII